MIKEALKDKLELDEQERKELILQAQRIEYMHGVLRSIGIADRLDEDIGREFMNTRVSAPISSEVIVSSVNDLNTESVASD